MIRIDTHIDDDLPAVDTARLRDAIHWVLRRHRVTQAEISLAVIGDLQMHALNLQHLQHDYPTDVLSFVYAEGETLEGEVIVSVETAARQAEVYKWQLEDELLLYVIHGTLHLVGHDDHEEAARLRMRACEREALLQFGLEPHDDESEQTLDSHDVS